MHEQITTIGFFVIKILTVISLLLYSVFAGIMVRQEQLMSKVLADTSEGFIRLLALIHVIAAVATVVLAIILL